MTPTTIREDWCPHCERERPMRVHRGALAWTLTCCECRTIVACGIAPAPDVTRAGVGEVVA